jgi:uncharacterized membrane protein YdfJ with MMPL/SSD domain
MDYEVFILARMRESYDRRGDTRAVVIESIGRTGRLVTSAALILVLSFLAISTAPQTDIRSSPPVSADILIDTTLIRYFLVPAFVRLRAAYNWWLPAWPRAYCASSHHTCTQPACPVRPPYAKPSPSRARVARRMSPTLAGDGCKGPLARL